MPSLSNDVIGTLLKKGVKAPCPESVEIGSEVIPEKISGEGVIIHTGSKIFGEKTVIMPGAEIGYEAPVTLSDCQLARGVKLKGGYFSGATFLEKAEMGSGSHIREGCLLEEGARCAHTVGLKQTILFPYVTLGSLINFCDCFMAGGTSSKNHSEVGSSYIHFNYSPNQDKATPSLIGDVPEGVMLDKPPIFLGGQGGLVGPVKINYGAVVAAGTIVRKDFLKGRSILLGQSAPNRSMPFHSGLYMGIQRLIKMNVIYIANMIALRRWYLDVRSKFFNGNRMMELVFKGAVDKLEMTIKERLKRMGEVAARMPRSIEIWKEISSNSAPVEAIARKNEFNKNWAEMEASFIDCMDETGESSLRDKFINSIDKGLAEFGSDYLLVIKNLTEDEKITGREWLQELVDDSSRKAFAKVPGFGLEV